MSNRNNQVVQERYDALLFARDQKQARKAATELVEVVLGEEARTMPIRQALVECCRRLRPSTDPKDQARFEAEFVELALGPESSQVLAA